MKADRWLRPGSTATVLAGLLLSAHPAIRLSAQSIRTVTSSRQQRGEDSLRVRVEFGAGRFNLRPATGGLLYRARLEYDEETFLPVLDYRPGDGLLTVGVEGLDRRGRRRVSWDVKDLHDLPQMLDLALGTRVVTDLGLELGAVEADVELGGLSLSRVELQGGAAKTDVRFSQANPARCEELDVTVGAGEFRLHDIGNSRCRRVSFAGGVGDLTIDLTGAWREDTEVEIKAALGDLTLYLPDDVGVSVTIDKFLASFSASRLRRVADSNTFRSANWDTARIKLNVEINVAFGSVRTHIGPPPGN